MTRGISGNVDPNQGLTRQDAQALLNNKDGGKFEFKDGTATLSVKVKGEEKTVVVHGARSKLMARAAIIKTLEKIIESAPHESVRHPQRKHNNNPERLNQKSISNLRSAEGVHSKSRDVAAKHFPERKKEKAERETVDLPLARERKMRTAEERQAFLPDREEKAEREVAQKTNRVKEVRTPPSERKTVRERISEVEIDEGAREVAKVVPKTEKEVRAPRLRQEPEVAPQQFKPKK